MRFATTRAVRELTSLPGCNQVCVSHGAYVFPDHRGKGIGLEEHKLALSEMKRQDYDYAICTMRDENKAQVTILNQAGWSCLSHFKSSYTGNLVSLWGKAL